MQGKPVIQKSRVRVTVAYRTRSRDKAVQKTSKNRQKFMCLIIYEQKIVFEILLRLLVSNRAKIHS